MNRNLSGREFYCYRLNFLQGFPVETLEHYHTIVPRSLRGTLNWVPLCRKLGGKSPLEIFPGCMTAVYTYLEKFPHQIIQFSNFDISAQSISVMDDHDNSPIAMLLHAWHAHIYMYISSIYTHIYVYIWFKDVFNHGPVDISI